MKNTEEYKKVHVEFKEAIEGFRLEFGDTLHLDLVKKTLTIAKMEKMKETSKTIKEIIRLKKSVIWLIKLDF